MERFASPSTFPSRSNFDARRSIAAAIYFAASCDFSRRMRASWRYLIYQSPWVGRAPAAMLDLCFLINWLLVLVLAAPAF